MTNFIISGLLWTLALYGLIEIIRTIISSFMNTKSEGIYMIIGIKDEEERIECELRSLLFNIVYRKELDLKNIIIADLNSSDSCKEILCKLKKDYDFVKIMHWDECKKIVDKISNT